MRFTDKAPLRATTDERCPFVEPEIGKNNSCTNGLSESEIKDGTRIVRRPSGSTVGFGFNYDRSSYELNEIWADTPAEKAGLKVGDVVIALDGIPIEDSPAFNEPKKPGVIYRLSIERDSEPYIFKITADEFSYPETLWRGDKNGNWEIVK